MLASWYTLGGYRLTLERMGHEVIDVALPGNQVNKQGVQYPMEATLRSCDCIIIGFAEYVVPWLQELYGLERWRAIPVPKIARYDESFDRRDLAHLMDWEKLKRWADHHFFPAKQDAERFDGHFLPYAADDSIFTPQDRKKKYDLGFIGQMYDKRKYYANCLLPHLEGITFNGGPVIISDLSGTPALGFELEQTQLLAKNYSQIKVFFCLPPLSSLIVCKAFEVMGCGTFLMYPRLEGDARKNLSIFEDGKHLVYYTLGDYVGNASRIRYYLEHQEERERIAEAGCKLIREKYRLYQMFERMLTPVSSEALLTTT